MKIHFDFKGESFSKADACIFAGFAKDDEVSLKSLNDKNLISEIQELKSFELFPAVRDTILTTEIAGIIHILSLGEKKGYGFPELRVSAAKLYRNLSCQNTKKIAIDLDGLVLKKDAAKTLDIFLEGFLLAAYSFEKYKSKKTEVKLKEIVICSTDKTLKRKVDAILEAVTGRVDSVNITRDFLNEVPNVLHSVEYAKLIEKDVKKNLSGVQVKILNKAEIKKENMNLFLSVNSGSAHEPRLVHLTYTPKKMKKTAKHYALVGKGITFDTGGYSLKPGNFMVNMKYDMGGSATLYGAFRAAVLADSPNKISCILPITDNAVNEHATVPDSVVTARNGKTVEILNTDAEGRLILADALDYACDLEPDAIIDAATLTGACLVALGQEVCALLGNNQKLIDQMMKSAKDQDEYAWQLPIIKEWREDMTKSATADLRNIGTTRYAGTATAAAFLENFIKNDIPWIHLDIAGVADSQAHLAYCPPKGGSGVMVRTVSDLICR